MELGQWNWDNGIGTMEFGGQTNRVPNSIWPKYIFWPKFTKIQFFDKHFHGKEEISDLRWRHLRNTENLQTNEQIIGWSGWRGVRVQRIDPAKSSCQNSQGVVCKGKRAGRFRRRIRKSSVFRCCFRSVPGVRVRAASKQRYEICFRCSSQDVSKSGTRLCWVDWKGHLKPNGVEWKPFMCFQLLGWVSSPCPEAYTSALRGNRVSPDDCCLQRFQMDQLFARYVLIVLYSFFYCSVRFSNWFTIEFAVESALNLAVHAFLLSSDAEPIRSQGPDGRRWLFSQKITTKMHGSGEQHQAWIFRRVTQSEESPWHNFAGSPLPCLRCAAAGATVLNRLRQRRPRPTPRPAPQRPHGP